MSKAKKQKREHLKLEVLERDGYECKVCKFKGSLEFYDIHHITPRDNMPGGGYVLSNLITLCNIGEAWPEGCHKEAEDYIKGKSLNEIFSPAKLYDKIGSSFTQAWQDSIELANIETPEQATGLPAIFIDWQAVQKSNPGVFQKVLDWQLARFPYVMSPDVNFPYGYLRYQVTAPVAILFLEEYNIRVSVVQAGAFGPERLKEHEGYFWHLWSPKVEIIHPESEGYKNGFLEAWVDGIEYAFTFYNFDKLV